MPANALPGRAIHHAVASLRTSIEPGPTRFGKAIEPALRHVPLRGPHQLRRVSDELGVKSSAISSIRGNLIRKGIVFAPSGGMIAFRMPLADRYVRDHADFFFDLSTQQYQTLLNAE